MGPCGDQAPRSVSAEDAGRHSIDGQLPSWVVHVGKHDQSRRFETGGQFNTLRLVAIDGDRFGRLGSRSRMPGRRSAGRGDRLPARPGLWDRGPCRINEKTRAPPIAGHRVEMLPGRASANVRLESIRSAESFAAIEGNEATETTTLIVSLMNLTLPSPNRQLTPPGW